MTIPNTLPDWEKSYWYDSEPIDPEKEGIPGPGARAYITYSLVDLGEWLAPLRTGTVYVFRPGKRYDLVLLTDDGWITQYPDALFTGAEGDTGKFISNITGTSAPLPVSTSNVIIAARLSKL